LDREYVFGVGLPPVIYNAKPRKGIKTNGQGNKGLLGKISKFRLLNHPAILDP
jgi:hypothetical protein